MKIKYKSDFIGYMTFEMKSITLCQCYIDVFALLGNTKCQKVFTRYSYAYKEDTILCLLFRRLVNNATSYFRNPLATQQYMIKFNDELRTIKMHFK